MKDIVIDQYGSVEELKERQALKQIVKSSVKLYCLMKQG